MVLQDLANGGAVLPAALRVLAVLATGLFGLNYSEGGLRA